MEMRLWCETAGDWSAQYVAEFVSAWQASNRLATDRVATHAVSAFGKESGKNYAHDACRQALSFARARSKSPVRYEGTPAHVPSAGAVLPVVVTRAPLFTCELGPAGEVVLQPVDRFDVWVYTGKRERHRVYVRSEAGLESMAEALNDLKARLAGPDR